MTVASNYSALNSAAYHLFRNTSCTNLIKFHLPKNVTKVFECEQRNSDYVLRIGGIQSAPMMRMGKNGKLTGLVVDAVRYLMRVNRISYILFECADPQMGFFRNGSWTGCLGMIQRKEMDLFLMPSAPLPSRMEISTPSAPLVNADLIMMSGEPEKVSVTSLGAIGQFDANVWLILAMAFVLVVSVSIVSERFWRLRTRNRARFSSSITGFEKRAESYNFARTFFSFLGTFAFQSVPFSNPDDSWRIMLAIWSFSVLVVMTLFSGQLTASMTVSNQFIVMDTLADVLRYKNLKPVIMAKTSFEYFFRDADVGSEPRGIFDRARDLGGLVPFSTHANATHIAEMLARRAVIIGPPFALKSKIGLYCKKKSNVTIHFSKGHYYERMMTMSFRFGLPQPIIEGINYGLHRYMDAGHVLKFVRSTELNASPCVWSEPPADRERVLTLDNVSGPFVMWCFGISVSLCVFVLEMITNRTGLRSYSQNHLRYSTPGFFDPFSGQGLYNQPNSGNTNRKKRRKPKQSALRMSNCSRLVTLTRETRGQTLDNS